MLLDVRRLWTVSPQGGVRLNRWEVRFGEAGEFIVEILRLGLAVVSDSRHALRDISAWLL